MPGWHLAEQCHVPLDPVTRHLTVDRSTKDRQELAQGRAARGRGLLCEPAVDVIGGEFTKASPPQTGNDSMLDQDPARLDGHPIPTIEPECQPVPQGVFDRELVALHSDPIVKVPEDVSQSALRLRLGLAARTFDDALAVRSEADVRRRDPTLARIRVMQPTFSAATPGAHGVQPRTREA